MTKTAKAYDLEERTELFAKQVRLFITKIPRTIGNIEDGKQLVRSSGSVGANYTCPVKLYNLHKYYLSKSLLFNRVKSKRVAEQKRFQNED